MLSESLSLDAFLDHSSQDSQLSGTSVVQFNVELVGKLLSLQGLSEVSGSVVSGVVGSRPSDGLHEANSEQDLEKAERWDGTDSINTVRDGRERNGSIKGDGAREFDSGVVDKGSDDCHHGNTSVLALNGTTTLESLGLGLEVSKRVENSERLGGSDLELVDLKGTGSASILGRSEGSGRGNQGSKGNDLHLSILSANTNNNLTTRRC